MLHWSLPALEHSIPSTVYNRLDEIQVDPEQGRSDTGHFLYLNLKTAEPKWKISATFRRRRINREKFRKLLLDGINVQWNKTIVAMDTEGFGVTAIFQDGSRVSGRLLVGADGSTSMTRRLLCPQTGLLYQLPIRFIGGVFRLSPSEIAPLRAFDPLLFLGTHSDTNTFMWYSILDTPEVNGSSGENEYYSIQLSLSWHVETAEDEVPSLNSERLKRMKLLASVFEERFRTVIEQIPDDAEITEVKLRDWPCLDWPNFGGKVTLIGDAYVCFL